MRKIALLAVALCLLGAHAAPVEVFTRGDAADAAKRFVDAKNSYSFVSLPAGEFKSPNVVQYATLNVPDSIKMERSEHEVEVGIIVSDQGKVVATCIVSSNCKALEAAAQNLATALRFRPASLKGQPVSFYVIMPVSYKYTDPVAPRK